MERERGQEGRGREGERRGKGGEGPVRVSQVPGIHPCKCVSLAGKETRKLSCRKDDRAMHPI